MDPDYKSAFHIVKEVLTDNDSNATIDQCLIRFQIFSIPESNLIIQFLSLFVENSIQNGVYLDQKLSKRITLIKKYVHMENVSQQLCVLISLIELQYYKHHFSFADIDQVVDTLENGCIIFPLVRNHWSMAVDLTAPNNTTIECRITIMKRCLHFRVSIDAYDDEDYDEGKVVIYDNVDGQYILETPSVWY